MISSLNKKTPYKLVNELYMVKFFVVHLRIKCCEYVNSGSLIQFSLCISITLWFAMEMNHISIHQISQLGAAVAGLGCF